MPTENNEFPTKYAKRIPQEFIDAVDSMDENEIKQRVLTCEGNLYEIASAKAADAKLTDAKEVSKDLSKPYAESKATETAKIQYCLFVLESRGINLNS
jgi:hypothetical protein